MYSVFMAEKDNNQELHGELDQLKTQVALLTRYVKVLQDKVNVLEKWHADEKYKGVPTRGLSDFGTPGNKSALGASIRDITSYPVRYQQPESD